MNASRLTEPRDIDDLLFYRLWRLLASGGADVSRLCEDSYGITRREWRLLSLLAAGEGVLSSELAGRAHLDRARTSRAVSALTDKRLVMRQPCPGDARQVRLSLTQQGRALYEALFPQVVAINQALLAGLSPAQVAWLDEILDTLQARADGDSG